MSSYYTRPARGRFRSPTAADVSTLAHNRDQLARARTKSPEPSLFSSGGDTPALTASGVDPAVLRDLPWQARHAAAAAATQAEVYKIVAEFADLDEQSAQDWAVFAGYAEHPGTVAYVQRVAAWLQNAYGPGSSR